MNRHDFFSNLITEFPIESGKRHKLAAIPSFVLPLIILMSSMAGLSATDYYIDSAATGTSSGTSWGNAWKGLGSVVWNGSGVKAGDTLYISGGAVSKTYAGTLNVSASGSSATNRVTVKVGRDNGHTGVVTVGGIDMRNTNFVTIDGSVNGQRRLKIAPGSYLEAIGTVSPQILHVEISDTGTGIHAIYGSGGEFAYNYLHGIQADAAIAMAARNLGVSQYDLTLVHHNIIQVNSTQYSGTGPDGVQQTQGVSIYDNTIYGKNGTVTGAEHQDLIQTYGTTYIKIYNNLFSDTGDSMIGCDSSASNVLIHNNVFYTTGPSGTTAIRFYNSSAYSNIRIENNTFVDMALQYQDYGAAIQFNSPNSGSAAVNNCAIQNNIFYNCGRGYPVMQLKLSAGLVIDYNLLNAGALGNTDISYPGFSGQAHGQSGVPGFVSYVQGAGTANDFRLKSTDAAAKDRGIALAGFTTDKDGIDRPQGANWDIGAYEFVSSGANRAPVSTAQSVSTSEDVAKAITLAATDADGNALTYAIVTNPVHGTLSGSGSARTYTPVANYTGADSFTFKANDGTADSNTAMVSLTVTAVNDVPLATAQSITTPRNTAKAITLSGTDVEGSALIYAIVANPAHGTLAGSGASRTYTPTSSYTGGDSFTFTVNDGTATSAAATVTITVSAVGDTTPPATPPAPTIAGSDPARPILSGTTEAGATMSIFVDGVAVGTVVANGAGQWTWTPGAPLAPGSHAITVIATDAAGNASTSSPASMVSVPSGSAPVDNGGRCGLGSGLAVLAGLLMTLGFAWLRRR